MESLVFRRIAARVFGLAQGMLHERDLALDVTQESMIRCHEQCRDGREEVRQAFALKVAYRLALNAARDRRRRASQQDRVARAMYASREQDPDLGHLRRLVIERTLSQLSSRQQQALRLRYYGELNTVETARAMGITPGAVKTHLARGLEQLRARLCGAPAGKSKS